MLDDKDYETRMGKAVDVLHKEFSSLRTGRASQSLLEPVQVEAYGSKMPLVGVATISVPDARTLSVNVWDQTLVGNVEKAILESDLGLNPQTEGAVLRIRLPELTQERRRELMKVAGKYAEGARVAVRNIRRDGMEQLKKMQKNSEISEDEMHKSAEQLQKLTDRFIADIDTALTNKEKGHHADMMSTVNDAANPVPQHVGIIMDGNGRWAEQHGFARIQGHEAGCTRVSDIIKAAHNLGVKILTLYSFSTENWKRPQDEIQQLFSMIVRFIDQYRKEFLEKNIRFTVIGDIGKLPTQTQKKINELVRQSENHQKMTVCVALNYGGRADILKAAKAMAADILAEKQTLENITEDDFADRLYTADTPDPELMIRTGGEQRISNFLIWQIAYSELYFTQTLWPDFDEHHFQKAIEDYTTRQRRFGALTVGKE